jgi:hypothetical protein
MKHKYNRHGSLYEGRLYAGISNGANVPFEENTLPAEYVNSILHKTSEFMCELPDKSGSSCGYVAAI